MSLLFCIVSVYAIAIYCKCVCANKILSIFYSLKKNSLYWYATERYMLHEYLSTCLRLSDYI